MPKPIRALYADDSPWFPNQETRFARPIRHQIAVRGRAAMVRIEATQPGDPAGEQETEAFQLGMTAEDCRLLARHLNEVADLLDRDKRPLQ